MYKYLGFEFLIGICFDFELHGLIHTYILSMPHHASPTKNVKRYNWYITGIQLFTMQTYIHMHMNEDAANVCFQIADNLNKIAL